jgi:hypothetical protein
VSRANSRLRKDTEFSVKGESKSEERNPAPDKRARKGYDLLRGERCFQTERLPCKTVKTAFRATTITNMYMSVHAILLYGIYNVNIQSNNKAASNSSRRRKGGPVSQPTQFKRKLL